jgi:hypothetical protein
MGRVRGTCRRVGVSAFGHTTWFTWLVGTRGERIPFVRRGASETFPCAPGSYSLSDTPIRSPKEPPKSKIFIYNTFFMCSFLCR